eukprot:TRINITY_DN7138_c0_g1_i2.p2 TRINITY_DN7138_c0_g1~~TRINITY_DN7138_c0_g1_i2.p2  ORF type:complete len:217 (-),score=53.06 TRINITY_DN7138_c0_g1_i2:287-853(-)
MRRCGPTLAIHLHDGRSASELHATCGNPKLLSLAVCVATAWHSLAHSGKELRGHQLYDDDAVVSEVVPASASPTADAPRVGEDDGSDGESDSDGDTSDSDGSGDGSGDDYTPYGSTGDSDDASDDSEDSEERYYVNDTATFQRAATYTDELFVRAEAAVFNAGLSAGAVVVEDAWHKDIKHDKAMREK